MGPWIIPYALFVLIAGGITLVVTGQLRDLRGAEQLVFHNKWSLLLLGACVLLFWVLFHLGQKRSASFRFSRHADLVRAGRGPISYLATLPRVLRVVAIGLLAVALARPQASRRQEIEVEGIDIMLVLDMSKSMEETDLRHDRLDAAQRTIRHFLTGRKNDRIGLVVFAKQALLQCPPTLDYVALDRMVSDLSLGDIEPMGTAIGDGLGLALASLRRSDARSKVVILLTDGDSNVVNEMSPEESKDLAAQMKVKVFTVLVGREQGASGNMRDPFGRQEHATNPALLKKIASDTGGKYFNAGDDAALERGFEEVRATLEKSKRKEVGRVFTELYPRFAGIAFGVLLLELLLSFTWFRRFP
jgi:Ca-activated chloride channel family protein